jgi:polar amino acid transport system ATP-binding protein
VNHLSKSFGSLKVLRDISFSLERGEVLAIIGSSGGGKTTLLRCLNFLETADSGSISVNESCIFDGSVKGKRREEEIRQARLHFGLVFQQFNLFPQYTVLKNVTLAPTLLGRGTPEEIQDTARRLLDRVGLSEKVDYYPCQLSGGQQQRVAIARALALSPDILCFDEPTSALDPELTGEVLSVIRGLKSGDSTMVVVTHEMEFARSVADKVIFMAKGVIEEMGSAEQIFENPHSPLLQSFLSKA